ncbi:Agamous-like MADS-box protein AGL8-like protein [Hibiscus syriacus]|uniref:Agamous-like MADS-box protein AGL8-like protein n=2 Tax=Hibiscus syriacus TaxID=106335 RepID=A0A6A3B7Z1_HIBSY|nr:Agamous-like MADS-box protein AGL8-like protein [Hibiscus syriacus]
MERILERYEQKSYAERQLASSSSESQENLSLECSKITSTIEVLQRNLRQFRGEELDTLSLRDLQLLEQQIGNSLKPIRTRKNKLMHESISLLQKRERSLQDQNNKLAKKLKEKEQTPTEHELRNLASSSSPPSVQPPATVQFPSLTIGGSYKSMEGSIREAQFNLNLVPIL